VRQVGEVIESFENEAKPRAFLASIFDAIMARLSLGIAPFSGFEINDFIDLAAFGLEVLNQVRGLALAEKALTQLYYRYLADELPKNWKQLFKEATRTAYNLKYMFRESLPKAKAKFYEHLDSNLSGKPKELFTVLVNGAFSMYNGLVDQETLAKTDFLTNPRALVKVVLDSVAGADDRVKLLGQIAAKYMLTYIEADPPKLPLTPHHTQICAMLIFSQFFEQRDRWRKEYGMEAAILQMKTGEGKSIVIAMMAIYTVVYFKRRVHVLENNEGLLERDFATYRSFYESFGLSCAKSIDDTSDICYCLKKHNNAYFNQKLLDGSLDLSSTVLIVDEVDDLVINEQPTLLYKASDVSLTPSYKTCYVALMKGEKRPAGIDNGIWNDCVRIKKEADTKVKTVHYDRGGSGWIMLELGPDGTPRSPKVPLTDDWLVYKNFVDFGVEPSKDTFRNCLCTPYMYTKYACIFGLTGSVGGEAERGYIRKTYQVVPYEVPQFLKTCDNTTKAEAKNLGVTIKKTTDEMIDEVVRLALQYHVDVPVLIISRGAEKDELKKITDKLLEALPDGPNDKSKGGLQRGGSGRLAWGKMRTLTKAMSNLTATPPGSPTKKPKPEEQGISAKCPRLQLLQERDETGKSMIDQVNSIIDLATKRCYNERREPYFRVTVTDWFGGRGHDFDCLNEKANENGGMLVIATTIPDAREWAQWKGRTARQDRPGQYFVVLCEEDEPFASERGLAASMRNQGKDAIIKDLLDRKDHAIAEALQSFEAQQARGSWINEMCEKYYKAHPRSLATPWPSEVLDFDGYGALDCKLRDMLSVPFSTGLKIKDTASERLQLQLSGPPANWGWEPEMEFKLEPKRQPMALIFLIDRTFEEFLQKVVDAVIGVYDKYLEPDDMIGYYGLGDDWIFKLQPKGEGMGDRRQDIVDSVKKAGDPNFYSSLKTCVDTLANEVDSERYSKWLVALSDTADFECANEKGVFDKASAGRAEKAAQEVIDTMQTMSGLNLVVIDASGIANFDIKHTLWPTWHRLSQKLTDDVGEANTGLNIQAARVSEIDEAFEKVAGAMSGGAAG